jgi:O-antigen ligase
MNGSAHPDLSKTMNTYSTRADWLLRLFVTILVLAYPAATLFINHGDSYTLGLLTIIGIWVWIHDGVRIWLNRDSGILCLVFALLFAVILLSYVSGYETVTGFHFLGRFLRFLFIVPVYLAFRRYPPTAKSVFIGLALGALVAGALASLEFIQAHGPIRVDAQTDLSIIFGDLTTTMVLCMVAGFGLMAVSRSRWSVPLLIICLGGGVIASLLSGTRGAWLPLFLLIPALATPAANFLKRRHIFAIVLILVTIFSSFYFIVSSGTQVRIMDIGKDLHNYFITLDMYETTKNQPKLQMHCLIRKKFLKAWLGAAHPAGSVIAKANVISEDTTLDTHIDNTQCLSRYAIRIQNPSISRAAQYVFPRASRDPGGKQQTHLLAMGAGVLTFAGGRGTGTSLNSPHKYINIVVNGYHTRGNAINVFVVPAGVVSLIPVDGYIGEYSFAIANTSIGQRLELWRAAWQLFLSHPFLGVGTGAYQEKTNELIQKSEIAPFIASYDHPHNDYLDALASRGILGLIILIAILLFPMRRFLQATRFQEHAKHAIGLAGVLTVAGFSIYALTDTIFLHSIMITWYVIYMALFYALLDTHVAQKVNSKLAE